MQLGCSHGAGGLCQGTKGQGPGLGRDPLFNESRIRHIPPSNGRSTKRLSGRFSRGRKGVEEKIISKACIVFGQGCTPVGVRRREGQVGSLSYRGRPGGMASAQGRGVGDRRKEVSTRGTWKQARTGRRRPDGVGRLTDGRGCVTRGGIVPYRAGKPLVAERTRGKASLGTFRIGCLSDRGGPRAVGVSPAIVSPALG